MIKAEMDITGLKSKQPRFYFMKSWYVGLHTNYEYNLWNMITDYYMKMNWNEKCLYYL